MPQIAIVVGLLILAIVLFAMETISVDVVTLLLLIVLLLAGILTPAEAFGAFSSEIVVILVAIFVLSGALQQTGVMDAVGMRLYRLVGSSGTRLLLALMGTVAAMSAFMNNTTATAVFVQPVMGLSKQAKISASKLLMPVAFASILGGTCTLIGTSTNIAVSGYIARAGLKPLGLFEITPVGLVIVAIGILYMALVGKRLLPAHKEESLAEDYAIRDYLTEIAVVPGSHLIGQRIFESDLARLDLRILEVLRREQRVLPDTRTEFQQGDVLLVEGKAENLMKVKAATGIEIRPELKAGELYLEHDDIKIVEALITPQSNLVGRTLKEANFRRRYRLTALAIYRHGQSLHEKIGRIRLRMGDLLLLQGRREQMESLQRNPNLRILGELNMPLFRKRRGLYAVTVFVAAVLAGWSGWLPLSVCFLAAAVSAILFRCITPEEAYKSVDWRLIVLIGGMTAFGAAMEKTGTAEFLAKGIVGFLQPYGASVIMAGFFVLTVLLTQLMSNAAAALVMLPIALTTAQTLGTNERTFAIAVMLAASVSFMTPLEPSCVLVYGLGKYRFIDFAKTGVWLTIILTVVVLLLIPLFWPL